jgi:hypothetical protein
MTSWANQIKLLRVLQGKVSTYNLFLSYELDSMLLSARIPSLRKYFVCFTGIVDREFDTFAILRSKVNAFNWTIRKLDVMYWC